MKHEPTVDYGELIGIAQAAVFEIASPSARSNLVGAIASDAVEQYLEAIARGDEIHSPHGWIQVAARCRGIDAMRQWNKTKKRNYRVDADDRGTDDFMRMASGSLATYMDDPNNDLGDVRTGLWVEQLIASSILDPVNQQIAIRCLVNGEKPGVVAADLDMEAPVVSSRLARIKKSLKAEITIEDLQN